MLCSIYTDSVSTVWAEVEDIVATCLLYRGNPNTEHPTKQKQNATVQQCKA